MKRHSGLAEANVEGFSGPFELIEFPSGQSNPTYRVPRRRVTMCSPQALRPAASVGACCRSGISASVRTSPARFPGANSARALQRLRCDRLDILRDGVGEGPGLRQWRAARLRSEHPPANVRATRRCVSGSAHASTPKPPSWAISAKPATISNDRWRARLGNTRNSQTDYIPEMERLIAFLPETLPEQSRSAIVHGDFRIDNVLFDGDGTLTAVLDWELATLGDPLADFSYLAMQWMLPADGSAALGGLDLQALGIPTLGQVAARYSERSGVPVRASSTGISPTTFSVSPGSSRASRSACSTEPPATPTRRKWPNACRCLLRPRGNSR